MRTGRAVWVGAWGLALQAALAQPMGPPAEAAAGAPEATLTLHHRQVVTFRATLLGDAPAERAAMASAALEAVPSGREQAVTRTQTGEAVRFEVDGRTVFFLVAGDLPGPRPELLLEAAAQRTEVRLRTALAEAREIDDPRRLAEGAAWSVAVTVLAWAVLVGVVRLRRRVQGLLRRSLQRAGWLAHAQGLAHAATSVAAWVLGAVVVDIWITYVLRQFAYTRPWGEQATAWALGVLQQFALGAAGAVPGLLTAALILLLARAVTRANTLFLERAANGDLRLGWLDEDTAAPTRRLVNGALWLFAMAMAYPYLPGANSDAFKGATVLAGLMLSLGASGVVGQAMSGFSLMYARALRVGEFVRVGNVEGTVTSIGLFATKVHTGLGEEVSLPNAVVLGQPVRNFSRLAGGGRYMLHAAVTIGYAVPWRQVHAMLLEAAGRTPGIDADPPPSVVQTALSDFYVEYRLCAQAGRTAPQRRAEAMSQLHANVQDVFNEHGIQILSPHYMADPSVPQVVPPGPWASRPS